MISWDYNLAMGGMGGGRFGGEQPPEGFELPEGVQPPAGEGQEPGGGFGGFGQGHQLKSRFLETPELNQYYERAMDELRQQLFASGAAQAALDRATAAALAAGADPAAVEADAAPLRTTIDDQTQG